VLLLSDHKNPKARMIHTKLESIQTTKNAVLKDLTHKKTPKHNFKQMTLNR